MLSLTFLAVCLVAASILFIALLKGNVVKGYRFFIQLLLQSYWSKPKPISGKEFLDIEKVMAQVSNDGNGLLLTLDAVKPDIMEIDNDILFTKMEEFDASTQETWLDTLQRKGLDKANKQGSSVIGEILGFKFRGDVVCIKSF